MAGSDGTWVRIGLGVMVGVILVAPAWWLARAWFGGGPCDRLAERVCTLSPEECAPLGALIDKAAVGADRCSAALEELEGSSDPVRARTAVLTLAGMDALVPIWDAADQWLASLDVVARIDFVARQELVGLGPAACVPVLRRWEREPDSELREQLHTLIVAMNRGTDLGDDYPSWQRWCQANVQLVLQKSARRHPSNATAP